MPKPHKCVPVPGEVGRFYVDSATDPDVTYIVDVLAKEQTHRNGIVTGTCPCKGWQVRKTCSHLEDSIIEFAKLLQQKGRRQSRRPSVKRRRS